MPTPSLKTLVLAEVDAITAEARGLVDDLTQTDSALLLTHEDARTLLEMVRNARAFLSLRPEAPEPAQPSAPPREVPGWWSIARNWW